MKDILCPIKKGFNFDKTPLEHAQIEHECLPSVNTYGQMAIHLCSTCNGNTRKALFEDILIEEVLLLEYFAIVAGDIFYGILTKLLEITNKVQIKAHSTIVGQCFTAIVHPKLFMSVLQ